MILADLTEIMSIRSLERTTNAQTSVSDALTSVYMDALLILSVVVTECRLLRLTCSGMEILSPLMSVSTLLSSITEFMLSIHRVSTGPSNMIHFSSGVSSLVENNNPHLMTIIT